MKTILAFTIAVALAFPAGAAAEPWLSYGTYEPDTVLDTPDYMWQDAPGSITNRVYFNAYTTWGDPGNNGAFINPNVGAARTNIDLAGPIYWEAVFGVWTDCNGDGYVGMAETAVREYSASVLLDDTLCPGSSGRITAWPAGANNYNGWVTELIPIANAVASNGDTRVYRDPEALVWADTGKPDASVGPPGTQCQGRARGDAQSTGGLLWNLDCQGNGIGLISTINEVDTATGLDLGGGDDPRQWDSVLNQPTFGSDSSDRSAVYAQDCNAEPLYVTGDLPGDDLDNVALLRPVPANPVGDPTTATLPGTLNYTAESIWTPPGTFGPNAGTDPNDQNSPNCNFEDDAGQDFYEFFEGNVDVPPYNGKDAAWQNFRFQTATRGSIPANLVRSGSSGAPTDLGITALGVECGPSSCFESAWFGGTGTYLPPIVATRANIDPENPANSDVGAGLPAAPYFTFYAYTGAAVSSIGLKSPGGQGVYGAPQCGDNVAGMHNGWNCDPNAWYARSDGSQPPLPGGVGVRARVGQIYNHRDVDCFDGRIGDTGLGASPAYYGPAPCER